MAIETHLTWGIEAVDADPGHWCARCLLPSAMKVTGVFYDVDTLRVTGRFARLWCPDCQQFLPCGPN